MLVLLFPVTSMQKRSRTAEEAKQELGLTIAFPCNPGPPVTLLIQQNGQHPIEQLVVSTKDNLDLIDRVLFVFELLRF